MRRNEPLKRWVKNRDKGIYRRGRPKWRMDPLIFGPGGPKGRKKKKVGRLI